MAFTLSHVIAILPFYNRCKKLPFDALAIGTMIPDLPYFMNSHNYNISHQWQGVLTYCLPYGLLVLFLWRTFIKDFFLEFYINGNLISEECKKNNFKTLFINLLYICFAIIIGTLTHLIWDGITHPDGFIAIKSDILKSSFLINENGNTIFFSRVLQYASSIIGLFILFILINKKIKILFDSNIKIIINLSLILVLLTVGIVNIYTYKELNNVDIYALLSNIIVEMGQAFMLLIIIFSLTYKLYLLLR